MERAGRSRRSTRVPGETGVWVFILGDLIVFAALFVAYAWIGAGEPELVERSQAQLDQTFGAINTLLLLGSSLLVVLAVRAIRAVGGGSPAARRLILGAFACGVGFSALKVVEYADKADHDLTPYTNDFFLYYFVLTGLHWFHLLMGLVVLAILWRLAGRTRLTPRQLVAVEGGGIFWHMVDLLWLVLFPLLYLVR